VQEHIDERKENVCENSEVFAHSMLVIDVLLSTSADDTEQLDRDDDDLSDEYVPVRLYVLGESVQSHLERYEWFNDFALGNQIPI